MNLPSLFFPLTPHPQDCFGYPGPLHFHMSFRISLSVSIKEADRIWKILTKSLTPHLILFCTNLFVSIYAVLSIVQKSSLKILSCFLNHRDSILGVLCLPAQFWVAVVIVVVMIIKANRFFCVYFVLGSLPSTYYFILSSQQSYDMVYC